MRRPTHHGGATSSRLYGVRWKGYRSLIQCCEWEEANDRGGLCRLDTGTVSLPSISQGVIVSTSSISSRNPVHRAMVGGLLFKHCLFPPGSREEKKIDRMLGNRQNLEES